MRWEVERRAEELRRQGQPFVLATVVRVERPASTRPGDRALVTPDGRLEGWVGGACSEPVVVREALRALVDRQARLVRIAPEAGGASEGWVSAVTTCPSGGTVELFLEPVEPDPHLVVFGESLVARTLVRLARTVGYRVTSVVGAESVGADADALFVRALPSAATSSVDGAVVATMGHWDEEALAEALRTPAGYVALVASRRRASSVLNELRRRGFREEDLARVRAPAGLDLGSPSQEEIALAVLAEFTQLRRAPTSRPHPLLPEEATDPVCGMTVSVRGALHTYAHRGTTYYFCCPHCREQFALDPDRYLAQPADTAHTGGWNRPSTAVQPPSTTSTDPVT
ncbi:MAG: XdhC family protein [Armatimonadota bacterium]|nr:XdhC family protein [Armatimonadota bacterium]MDR5676589.1 XdhC family protein [Armatimonadota bacterium]MDR5688448.1 XdhC family protein [Armatimonadota bacterium]MDR7388965.1 XdhC family protein [Armatimonadota bacterium]MDR7390454.1 XdhC family protein [Armatimonadota bacterium]